MRKEAQKGYKGQDQSSKYVIVAVRGQQSIAFCARLSAKGTGREEQETGGAEELAFATDRPEMANDILPTLLMRRYRVRRSVRVLITFLGAAMNFSCDSINAHRRQLPQARYIVRNNYYLKFSRELYTPCTGELQGIRRKVLKTGCLFRCPMADRSFEAGVRGEGTINRGRPTQVTGQPLTFILKHG